MHNTALIPHTEFLESPAQAPELMELALPPVDQQARVFELLEWLMSDPCGVTVISPSQVPDGEPLQRAIQGVERRSVQRLASRAG